MDWYEDMMGLAEENYRAEDNDGREWDELTEDEKYALALGEIEMISDSQ